MRAAQSWREHLGGTIRLGLPLVGSQFASIGFGVTDTLMLGWLGAEPLAAGVLATQFFFIVLVAGMGIAHGVAPLVAGAHGTGDVRGARRAARMGLWAALAFGALVLPLLWSAEPILRALGQLPELAALAGDYLDIAAFAIAVTLLQLVLRSFLTSLDHAGIVLWAALGGLLLNGILNWAFIFGHWGMPALGIQGAAVATLGSNLLVTLILVIYAAWHPAVRRFELFVRFWRADWPAMAELLQLAWPISLTLIAEISLFSVASLMLGWLGTVPLAAHGIALQITSVLFMIPLGLALAATTRVGQAYGRGDALAVSRAGYIAIALGVGISALAALMLVAIPEGLIRLFVDLGKPEAAAIIAYGAPLLLVAAAFQLVDAAQVLAMAALRGMKDTRVPMVMGVVSYFLLGAGSGWVLAFPLGMGGIGVWLGLALGLAAAALLLLARFDLMRRKMRDGA